MDTKHTTDTLKTMREPLKERDGQPPSLTQPKKQEIKTCYNCKYYEKMFDEYICHFKRQIISIWEVEPSEKLFECKNHKTKSQ